jgi:hypothetical protein
MKRLLRDLMLILALAALWASSGYIIGIAIETTGLDVYPLRIIFASFNLILGMGLFLGITKDPTAERFFFEGPDKDDRGQGYPQVGCLWAMPIGLLILGLLMWFWAIVLRLIFPQ